MYEGPGHDYADVLALMRALTPTHVVFNGRIGALHGDDALRARVGERILLVHSQANRDSRPRIVGVQADHVWETGSFADPPATGLETWFIRGGRPERSCTGSCSRASTTT